jgi:hypothetical protein
MPDQSWWTPATGGHPLTQGRRLRKSKRTRKRKFRAEIAQDSFVNPMVKIASTLAEMERLHVLAARDFFDPGNDLVPMVKELIAHDGMAREHDEPVPFNHGRMRVARVGRTNDGRPMFADRVLGRAPSNLMLLEQRLNDIREWLRGPFPRSLRIVKGNATQIPDELFGDSTELVRLIGHDGINH